MNNLLKMVLILLLISCGIAGYAAETKEFVVVLDAGHGGKDYGAIGSLTNEKTINLAVARRVRDYLKSTKGVRTILTRDKDVFLTLQQRADVANRAHGNLFVSIHVNSVDKNSKNRTTASGASVYTLGLHRTAANFEVAKRENSVMELEPDYSTAYQGFDPNSAESYIIFELNQNAHLDQSISFAQKAQTELVRTAGRANRGVFQAGFWVLLASAMPAALIELDFICNPTSEAFLASEAGQDKLAHAIANAIADYAGGAKPSAPAKSETKSEAKPRAKQEQKPDTSTSSASTAAVTYRVQFMACDRQLPAKSSEYRGLTDVECSHQGRLYKYVTGSFATEAEANAYLPTVKKKFPQAFVVKWQNGSRID
jgi:N-acetylmuramoyl-L-alanine amidase